MEFGSLVELEFGVEDVRVFIPCPIAPALQASGASHAERCSDPLVSLRQCFDRRCLLQLRAVGMKSKTRHLVQGVISQNMSYLIAQYLQRAVTRSPNVGLVFCKPVACWIARMYLCTKILATIRIASDSSVSILTSALDPLLEPVARNGDKVNT